MKPRLFLPVSLVLCLLLSACGGNNSIAGEVVEATPAALILQTDEGKRVAVLLEEDTYVFGMDDIDGNDYKAHPHTGVKVRFLPNGRAGSLTASDGTEVKAYHTDHFISIYGYLIPNAATLSDGTVLDAWKTSLFGTTYQLQDGTELLWEDAPSGPENLYVGSLESFDDLNEAAKPAVARFYEEQGKLYDLQAELEKAWVEYQASPETFSSYWVSQDTSPSASSERVMYFGTHLTLPVRQNIVEERSFYAAFDRETGAYIPLSALFSCPESEIGKNLLSLAEKDGWPDTPELKQEMVSAFQMEYLSFYPDGLCLEFPQGTLPSQEYSCLVSIDFTDDCKALLQPWAVPYPRAE